MASSSEPKKFLFNNRDFSEQGIEEEASGRSAAPPPPPTYTEAQLEVAKRTAYEQGQQEAAQAHRNSHEAQMAHLAEELLRRVQSLITAQDMQNALIESETLELTLAVMERLYPVLREKLNTEQFLFDAQELLQQARGQHNVAIQAHPEMLHDLTTLAGSMENVSVTSSGDIAPGDVRVTWAHGGTEIKREDIMKQLELLLRQALDGENRSETRQGQGAVDDHGGGLAQQDDGV